MHVETGCMEGFEQEQPCIHAIRDTPLTPLQRSEQAEVHNARSLEETGVFPALLQIWKSSPNKVLQMQSTENS